MLDLVGTNRKQAAGRKRFVVGLATFAVAACASTQSDARGARGSRSDVSSAASLAKKRFVVDPDTVICTSVDVQQELFGRPVDKDWRYGLSNSLVKEFRRNFSAIGKLGDPNRFRPDPFNVDPKCASPAVIRISVQYEKRGGLMFSVIQKISVGVDKSEAFRFRDIEAEWASGALTKFAQSDPIVDAISNDLKGISRNISEGVFDIK